MTPVGEFLSETILKALGPQVRQVQNDQVLAIYFLGGVIQELESRQFTPVPEDQNV